MTMIEETFGARAPLVTAGPALGEGLARYISCDCRVRAVLESEGRPVSVGRALRIVPDRTRVIVEDRELITGQNPRSDHAIGAAFVKALDRA